MCVVSMVFDYFTPRIDRYSVPGIWEVIQTPSQEMDELRKILAEFREALAAAKRVDVLTKQPDCEDTKKATLEERVAALEAKLALRDYDGGGGEGIQP